MANHKSALKRARQNEIRRMRNKSRKSRVKNVIKEVRSAVEQGDREVATDRFRSAESIIDKATKKGLLHRNNGARKISRLSKLVSTLN